MTGITVTVISAPSVLDPLQVVRYVQYQGNYCRLGDKVFHRLLG